MEYVADMKARVPMCRWSAYRNQQLGFQLRDLSFHSIHTASGGLDGSKSRLTTHRPTTTTATTTAGELDEFRGLGNAINHPAAHTRIPEAVE
jgi:hypothetical protein